MERSGTDRMTLGEVRDRTGTFLEVQDGSGEPRGGPGRVEGPWRKSGMGQGTLPEVRDGLGDPPVGLGWVGGPSGKSGTGRGTQGEVWNG